MLESILAASSWVGADQNKLLGITPNQPLKSLLMGCSNKEGWGPMSDKYADFTPCFWQGCLGLIMSFVFLVLGIYHVSILRNPKTKNVSNKIEWTFPVKQGLTIIQMIFFGIIYLKTKHYDFIKFAQSLDFLCIFVIIFIQYLQKFKCISSDGVVLFFWLWQCVLRSGIVLSLYLRSSKDSHFIVLSWLTFVNSLTVLTIELIFPLVQTDTYAYRRLSPYDKANIFAKLTFTWMNELMKKGYSCYLNEKDIPYLPHEIKSTVTAHEFKKQWLKKPRGSRSLFWSISRAFGSRVLQGSVFKVFMDVLGFIQPQLLRLLIKFVNDYSKSLNNPELPNVPLMRGFMISIAMFVVSAVQSLIAHQYYQRSFDLGMKIKTSLTSVIYAKSLVLSNDSRHKSSTGDIVNLMAVDIQRLQDLVQNIQIAWSGPFQILLCLISLYNLLGSLVWIALIVMVLLVPVNSQIARKQKQLQASQMKIKDERSNLVSEILSNIKSLKFYSWETPYLDKLNHIRNDKELQNLKRYGIFSSIAIFTANISPFLVSCTTFGIFILIKGNKETLLTDIIFPALALFNLLNLPLSVLPLVISNIVESQVAISRITEFLNSSEIQGNAVKRLPSVSEVGDIAIKVQNGSFSWSNKPNSKLVLQDIKFSAKKGQLSCVLGKVGSGKSSFLNSLLGELERKKGEVFVHGSTSYVPQVPWITNSTVRENILFGHRYDPEFYIEVLSACALIKDLETLPQGDLTEVGEKGISLSGGQKARISLARAVYARADNIILDDPLSAVDEHVGKHIMDKVLGPNGILKSRCRVLATNNIRVLGLSNEIHLIRDGKIIESGNYLSIMTLAKDTPLFNLLTEYGKHLGFENSTSVSDEDESEVVSQVMTRRASIATVELDESDNEEESERKESVQQGNVKWDVYKEYIEACNPKACLVFLFALIVSNALSVLSNVWLKHWSEVNTEKGYNPNVFYYLTIFIVLGFSSSLVSLIQTCVLWVFCTIQGSKVLHNKMAASIMRAPMSFFETTPIGRILNRFSNDIYKVDEQMGRVFGLFFTNFAKVLFTIIVICTSTWPFIFIVLPLTVVYVHFQAYFLRTSRELKRLDSVTRSPIFSNFQESLIGVSSIRAYDHIDRFKVKNHYLIDKNMRAFNPSVNANRWLAVRLEFLGAVIIFAASSLSTIMLSTGKLSAGIVGLSVSYALQVTNSLGTIVRMTVEVETNIVSVERIIEYSNLVSEAPFVIEENRPRELWPDNGLIKFKNYSTKYRPNLEPVLRNINLSINSKEKIGIVGRTGAGKSSLTLAIYRIIEAFDGHIEIDDIDTSKLGLFDLRSNLSIIPQDSQVFQGTIKSNLDPTNIFTDEQLWTVLEHAHLKETILSMFNDYNSENKKCPISDPLEVQLSEGGSNLSVGQRQLICLARALLIKSPILILDEATAAIDVETDKVIQETIRKEFVDRTIITIAHRLNTIIDSDRILVLEKGEVKEFDSPAKLLEMENGLFKSLCEEGGTLERS